MRRLRGNAKKDRYPSPVPRKRGVLPSPASSRSATSSSKLEKWHDGLCPPPQPRRKNPNRPPPRRRGGERLSGDLRKKRRPPSTSEDRLPALPRETSRAAAALSGRDTVSTGRSPLRRRLVVGPGRGVKRRGRKALLLPPKKYTAKGSAFPPRRRHPKAGRGGPRVLLRTDPENSLLRPLVSPKRGI